MPETYFGGNIASGGTMRAEFDVQTDVAGDIAGTVVITYEDVYGEQLEERLPLNMYVNEQMSMEPVFDDPSMMMPDGKDPMAGGDMAAMGGMDGMDGSAGGIGWYWWAIAILAVAAGVVVLGVMRHKKRQKELEAL